MKIIDKIKKIGINKKIMLKKKIQDKSIRNMKNNMHNKALKKPANEIMLLSFLLIISFTITSCNINNLLTHTNKINKIVLEEKQGLDVNFQDVNEDFYPGKYIIHAVITNFGIHAIHHGYFAIKNEEFIKVNKTISFSLEGRTLEDPIPKTKDIKIELNVLPRPKTLEGFDSYTVQLPWQVFFDYSTKIDFDVCLETKDELCKMQDVTIKKEGAPITITNVHVSRYITEKTIKYILEMTVDNIGQGNVFDINKINNIKDLKSRDFGIIRINYAKIGENNLKCEKEININNENIIKCEYAKNIDEASAVYPVSINLSYAYTYSGFLTINVVYSE